MPNPLGKDQGYEKITIQFFNSNPKIWKTRLDPSCYLKIAKQSKKLKGTIWKEIALTLTGSFNFPNRAACVELWCGARQMDKFCYPFAPENSLFQKTIKGIETLSLTDLSILQETQIKKEKEQICLYYQKDKIYCKHYSFSHSDPLEIKLYKNYIKQIEEYLRQGRSTIFFHSPLYFYQQIFKEDQKLLKQKKIFRNIADREVPLYDIQAQYYYLGLDQGEQFLGVSIPFYHYLQFLQKHKEIFGPQ
ncbi:MAG: hypothetical protein GXP45_07440 [bacterium]|nr:hypothetical protein [bacterium]